VTITRRRFLEHAGVFATGLLLTETGSAMAHMKAPMSDTVLAQGALTPFVDALPLPPVAKSVGTRMNPERKNEQIPYYKAVMREMHVKVHRDLPATRVWGFNDSSPGPVFETRSGESLLVEWTNELPLKHFLPIDYTLHGAGKDVPEVRSVVHLHGGRTPPESDGYPEDWFVPGKSAINFYPNQQDATALFYHDHAMGINRLNVYAGLQGMFLIRDAVEDALNLPSGKYEVPLVIYDRFLRKDGQLEYPVSPISGKPWVPEVFGNVVLVNGKATPYFDVEPRKYRLRILNGSNARFYRLAFDDDHEFHMIGSDQGLLKSPVALQRLQLAPAERADVIVDFSKYAGKRMQLESDSMPVMQFRVAAEGAVDPSALPMKLRAIERIQEKTAVKTRLLTLDEHLNLADQSMDMMLNNTPWHAPITENPVIDTTEIWEFVNLAEDTHPIHLHLVRFQVLDRQRIDTNAFFDNRSLEFIGDVEPATGIEAGWKDTVRADAGTLTRIIVPFKGYTGRYVWHCHLLEHEDNEMMRPYEILASEPQKTGE
jgi:spore coat protein A, manganese oxidase